MESLDELKGNWKNGNVLAKGSYDKETLQYVIKARMKRQTGLAMRYFWPAFTCQIMVYAMLSHVLIKYGAQTSILIIALSGISLFVPITWMMMSKFKKIATLNIGKPGITSMIDYISTQRQLLADFFVFKKRYELLLLPLASAIGVWLTFEIFFPGGISAFVSGAAITYLITLASCWYAIVLENKRNFRRPLDEMQIILQDAKENFV